MKTLIAKRWFDGTRYHGAEPGTLIIEGDRIVDLIPGIQMTTDEAQICEFVMPGLAEGHCHLFLEGSELDYRKRTDYLDAPLEQMLQVARDNVLRHLACGVTLVRDAGDRYGVNHRIRDETRSLDIRSAGAALRRPKRYGSFMAREVETPEDICSAVREIAKSSLDAKIIQTGIIDFESGTVKGAPQFALDGLTYFVQCAHEADMKTFAHCSGTEGIRIAVAAGVDSIEHGFFMTRELLSLMADQGTAWVPTFSPVHFQWKFPESAGWGPATVAKLRDILDSHAEHVALAAQLGVNLVAGSDAGSPGVEHGKSLIDEIFHFLRCGIPMEQALRSATSLPRELWGAPSADIRKGGRSDMIVLAGDPFIDSEHLRHVQTIVRHE
jgi:imidazolonepropionase-like amidohydrolase